MLEIPVKLIVKAPNQQIEDQTIQCCLTWTIKRLKGYLSEVYPSKPNTEDQRLIYYGQLLNDSVTLKDVFTRYEAGEEIHTVHLVCMPSKETLRMQARKIAEESNKKIKEVTSNGASTSQRIIMSEDENIQDNNQETHDVTAEGNASLPSRSSTSSTSSTIRGRNHFQPTGYQNWMSAFNPQSTESDNHYMQQWAWMQQLYAHYYLTQYMDMMARQNGFREEYSAHGRQGDAAHNAEAPAPRDIEDDDNRRDWLDYFCILSRLIVLLAILYFYSSPVRFLIVSSLGVALYLYQVGFFRINQLQAVENNNGVVNNNNNININNNNMHVNNNDNDNGDNNNEVERREDNVHNQVDHPSFIALTWTFVTSFFSSIIPETQNAL